MENTCESNKLLNYCGSTQEPEYLMNQSIPFSSKFKGVYCLVIERQKNQIKDSKKNE